MATRRKRNLVDTVLSESASAVCVLDAERRLRFFSPGMVTQTGWAADEVAGLLCEPATSSNASMTELLTSALCPSQEVLSGTIVTVDSVLPVRKGATVKTKLTFVPLQTSDGSVNRVIIISQANTAATVGQTSLSQKLHAEITALRLEFRRRFSDASFVGQCPEIRLALDRAEMLKSSGFCYSVVGPTGSGRRHLVNMIHVAGQHMEQSLVGLDCQLLLAEQVLETLRHLRRLSTERNPTQTQIGTLLLVDADRCPREVQQWLLENLVREAQGIRIVATCSQPLNAEHYDEWLLPEFRNLFAPMQIDLPALHHRENDIELLAQHYVEECHRTLNTSAETLSSELLKELRFYRWPGNVRELQKVVTEACQNSFEATLTPADLPFSFRAGMEAQNLPPTPQESVKSLDEILAKYETDVLLKTLASCDGNKAEAARRLGMTRPKFYRRMHTLGLDDDTTNDG